MRKKLTLQSLRKFDKNKLKHFFIIDILSHIKSNDHYVKFLIDYLLAFFLDDLASRRGKKKEEDIGLVYVIIYHT